MFDVHVRVRLTAQQAHKLRRLAARSGRTRSEAIRALIDAARINGEGR